MKSIHERINENYKRATARENHFEDSMKELMEENAKRLIRKERKRTVLTAVKYLLYAAGYLSLFFFFLIFPSIGLPVLIIALIGGGFMMGKDYNPMEGKDDPFCK